MCTEFDWYSLSCRDSLNHNHSVIRDRKWKCYCYKPASGWSADTWVHHTLTLNRFVEIQHTNKATEGLYHIVEHKNDIRSFAGCFKEAKTNNTCLHNIATSANANKPVRQLLLEIFTNIHISDAPNGTITCALMHVHASGPTWWHEARADLSKL